MNKNDRDVMFSSKSDEWSTPQYLFDTLNEEFHFQIDLAATLNNTLCEEYLGPDHFVEFMRDALIVLWITLGSVGWCNPPYSKCREFVAKAAEERLKGFTTVMLLPSRTDTRWFHDYVWDRTTHRPREGVELRFVKGRLKFGGASNSAPFPSLIVIFHGCQNTINRDSIAPHTLDSEMVRRDRDGYSQ